MYRLLITCDEPAEQDRLEGLIAARMPEVFEFMKVADLDHWIEHGEDAVADVILMKDEMMARQEVLQVMKNIDLQGKILFYSQADLHSDEDLLKGLRRQVQDLDQAFVRRAEERSSTNQESPLIPLTENLLAILLMQESRQDTKFHQLTEMLNIHWGMGFAMTIAFPQMEGISPTENHMRLTRYYARVNQFSKLLGPCVASPILNRYMTVFFAAEDEQLSMVVAMTRAERLYMLLDYLFGTEVTLGIGASMPMMELRQSYRQAAIAAAYGEAHDMSVATIEDVRRSAARRHTEWLKRDTSIEFQLRPELRTMVEELEQQRMQFGIK